MRERGLQVPAALLREGTVTAAATFDAVQALLRASSRNGERPTAILACSTLLAAGALRAVQHEGLRVPGSMAFATFDGFTYSDLSLDVVEAVAAECSGVVIVDEAYLEFARPGTESAVSLLLRRLETPDAPAKVLRLDSQIEFRRSTE